MAKICVTYFMDDPYTVFDHHIRLLINISYVGTSHCLKESIDTLCITAKVPMMGIHKSRYHGTLGSIRCGQELINKNETPAKNNEANNMGTAFEPP